jgi:nucleoside-diphosphate-sugar epimerase
MRCLVTGVAGFIGSHLAERLVSEGHEVVGVDAFTDYYARADKEQNLQRLRSSASFTLVELDLAVAALDRLVDGVDWVFHQAAQGGVRSSWGEAFDDYTRNNVLATQRLLEATYRAGSAKRLVHASSSSVYGDAVDLPMRESSRTMPHSPYGVTKLAAEHLVELYRRNFGVPAVSLRYFTVYGPRQRPDMGIHRFVERLLSGLSVEVHGDGSQTRDFTYVDDIVSANLAAASVSSAEGVYNVGGGSRIGLRALIELLAGLAGHDARAVHGEAQAGDVRDTSADISRATLELGYVPKVTLEEGLTRQIDWHRARRART